MNDGFMSLVTLPNVLGAIGAIFYVASMSMKTAIPLRITALVSTFFFVECGDAYALGSGDNPLYAVVANSLNPSLSDVGAHQESPRSCRL